MALYSQRHFNTGTLHLTSVPCSVFSSFHALSTSSILVPYPESSAKMNYRTWRFIGPRQLVRVWSINWLLYWAGRGNVALSLWWSPLSLWNRRGFCPGELEVETRDSTNLYDFIMWFHMISWVLDGFKHFYDSMILAIFLWTFATSPWFSLWFFVTTNPGRTRFNISMPGRKIIIAAIGTKHHHFKRVCWELRSETRRSFRMR